MKKMPDDIRELRHPDFFGLQLAEQPVTVGARIARNVDTWKYGLLNKRPGLRRMNQRQYLGQIVAIADLQRVCDYGKFLILSGLAGGGEIFEHQQMWFDPTPPGFAGAGPWGGGGGGGVGGGNDPEPPFNPNWPPIAVPIASTATVCVGVPVFFSGDASWDPDGEIVSYWWNFGDGTTSALANPEHTFTAPGLMDVTLTVMDDSGEMVTESVQVEVRAWAIEDDLSVISLDEVSHVALDDEFAYCLTARATGWLVKVRRENMVVTAAVALPVGFNVSNPEGIVVDDTYLYFTAGGSVAGQSRVGRARKSDLGGIIFVEGGATTLLGAFGITHDGTHLYVACVTSNRVTKILMSTLAIVDTIQDALNLSGARSIVLEGGLLYVGCNGRLTRVTTAPLAVSASVADAALVNLYAMDARNGFAYPCSATADNISKVRLSDMTVISTLVDAVRLNLPYGVQCSDDFAYVSAYFQDSIARVNTETMTIDDEIIDGLRLNGVRGSALDHALNELFVTANLGDYIVKIRCAV